jgi:cytochrome c peroxidase
MRLRLKRGLLTLAAALLGLPLLTGFALDRFDWNLPAWVPIPVVPLDNPMTNAKVELGRHLFYDTRLSADKSMSCASCHQPDKAFTDGLSVSEGIT